MERINKFRSRAEAIFDRKIVGQANTTHTTLQGGNQPLCRRCRKLCVKIDAMLSLADNQQSRSAPRQFLGAPDSWDPSCSTCRFFFGFFNIWIQISHPMTSDVWLEFHAEGFERCPLDPNPEPHRLVAYLNADSSNSSSRRISRPITFISSECRNQYSGIASRKVNFGLVNEWLDVCKLNHSCHGNAFSHAIDITLINCATRKLEHKKSTESFIALSYVWGPSPAENTATLQSIESQLSNLPLLIKDSIQVCTELGINYLWVDRYCISQDPKESHKQIASMDAVYQEAKLTIIAVSTENTSSGLPGVSQIDRLQQRFVEIDRWVMLSCLGRPQKHVLDSIWNSRGWTYQEAMLSTRRLYFTEEQVFFECQASIWQEALPNLPWERLRPHLRGKEGESSKSRPHVFPPYDRMAIDNIWEIIEHYSTRHLTYPSDALNAMLGVFRFLSQEEYPRPKKKIMYHHWGIPFEFLANDPKRYKIATSQFLVGILFRVVLGPITKREGFPAWSWTSWPGKVFLHEAKLLKFPRFEKNLVTAVEFKNGLRQTWQEFLDNFPTADPSTFSIYVHVAGPVINLCIPYIERNVHGHLKYTQHTLGGIDVKDEDIWVHFHDHELQERDLRIKVEPLTCVLLASSRHALMALILRERNDCFERVGTMELQLNKKKSFGRDPQKLKSIVLTDWTLIGFELFEYRTLRLG